MFGSARESRLVFVGGQELQPWDWKSSMIFRGEADGWVGGVSMVVGGGGGRDLRKRDLMVEGSGRGECWWDNKITEVGDEEAGTCVLLGASYTLYTYIISPLYPNHDQRFELGGGRKRKIPCRGAVLHPAGPPAVIA